jgi:hypothetical protein
MCTVQAHQRRTLFSTSSAPANLQLQPAQAGLPALHGAGHLLADPMAQP